jgi:hypothetical protein
MIINKNVTKLDIWFGGNRLKLYMGQQLQNFLDQI